MLAFDYFHVVQLATRALDEVRRRERREFPQQLPGARWALLKPQSQFTAEQQQIRQRVCSGQLQTGKAFSPLDALRTIMAQADVRTTEADPKGWCSWVARSASQR